MQAGRQKEATLAAFRLVLRVTAVVLVIGGFARQALAQTTADKAAAEALFDQGRAAMQEGDFNRACGLLERSQHVDPAVGTLLYLAECYERSERTASAWATFREAADAAAAANDVRRARVGRERAERIEPILSRLTIEVVPEAQQLPGFTVERGNKPVQGAMFNVPLPIDPGSYTVTAVAPGYQLWSGTVMVPGRGGHVSIRVPALHPASTEANKSATPATPTLPAGVSGSSPVGRTTDTPAAALDLSSGPSPSGWSGRQTVALVAGSAGVAAIVAGTVFGLRAYSKNSEAKEHCPVAINCNDARGPELGSQARNAATVANIAFGVGLVALTSGIVLYATAPRAGGAESGALSARIGLRGISMEGTF